MVNTQTRDSTLNKLKERVSKEKYEYYLRSMEIYKLRGLSETKIRFDFPVTAIVGPNGSGKSTVLGAAGLICKDLQPRIFFARSGEYDLDMKDWRVEYRLLHPIQSNSSLGNGITRTASYRQAKWNRDAIERPVRYIGIFRTIPAAERKSLSSFVGGAFKAKREEQLTEQTKLAVEQILGKPADDYVMLSNSVDTGSGIDRKAIFASAPHGRGKPSYSEFHFGAGEASIISIVDEIERSDDGALILIEELENGLHPVATRCLVEYLVDAARRKSCQVIFTTHSNDALDGLPTEAVWSVNRGKLFQGKLDVASLRALTGETAIECAIFTEDAFSKQFVDRSLRMFSFDVDGTKSKPDRSQIEIYPLGGEAQVTAHTKHHNDDPSSHFPVIGVLDGDMRDKGIITSSFEGKEFQSIVYCPGDDDPEAAIYGDILSACKGAAGVENPLAKLNVVLNPGGGSQQTLLEKMDNIKCSTRDPHLLFERLGEELDFTAGADVSSAFIDQWCRIYPEKLEEVWKDCIQVLPRKGAD